MLGAIIGAISTIASAAVAAVKVLATVGMAIEGVKAIGGALLGIAKTLGIIKPETEVDELGDKALQAYEIGIKPENYDSYEEYVKAVQDFKTDPEKSKLYTDEQKINKGTELSYGVAMEKCPTVDFESLIKTSENSSFMDKIGRFGELCKMAISNPNELNDAVKFINGNQKSARGIDSAISTLSSIEKQITPGISDNDACRNVLNYQK